MNERITMSNCFAIRRDIFLHGRGSESWECHFQRSHTQAGPHSLEESAKMMIKGARGALGGKHPRETAGCVWWADSEGCHWGAKGRWGEAGRGRGGNTSDGLPRLSASIWQSPLSYPSRGNVWGLVTDKPLLVLLSTELLKGEPSVFGPLGHNQNTCGTKIQGWRMVWETSYFLYNTHTHTWRIEPASTLSQHKCTLKMIESRTLMQIM